MATISTNYNGYKTMKSITNLRGVDYTTPVDEMEDGYSPFAKNFRLYAQQTDDRRVAVSSRKGPGFYISPLNETFSMSNVATTDASTAECGIISDIRIQPFTSSVTGRLTKIELNVSNVNGGNAPLLISIYSDQDDMPYELLSETSITSGISSAETYVSARFLNAPSLVATNKYYIIISQQEDGSGTYTLSTTSDDTPSYVTNSTIADMLVTTFSINYKLYTTEEVAYKGSFRFVRDNGDNKTVVVYGTVMYKVDETTHALVSIATGLSSSATRYSFTSIDNKLIWVNGYDSMKYWDGTTVGTITDAELPILSDVVSHKDRLWGVTAADPNKLVFSENPGNPSDLAANLQWYNAWLSVSFMYAPRPHNGSPVTAMVSFQDSLTVFTQDNKYVISGSDRGSFNLREATGNKGALSHRGVVNDENNIYFEADDGLYVHNGSSDTKLSDLISPILDGCGDKNKITPIIWKNQVRFYMGSNGSNVNDICVIYDKTTKQLLIDTDTFIDEALYYSDADDNQELVEFSSLYPCAFYAEQGYNSLGAPIDFEYRLNYLSLGTPGQRKQIKRFKPLIQATDSTFTIKIGMDKDFEDSPKIKDLELKSNSSTWDNFYWDDGTLYGGDVAFKEYKLSYSGYANYWQPRIIHKAVNNRVGFIGIQFKYKVKKI